MNDLELGDRLVRSGAHGWLVRPGLTGGSLRRAVRKAAESTPKDWILAEYVGSPGASGRTPEAGKPAAGTADVSPVCTAPTMAAADARLSDRRTAGTPPSAARDSAPPPARGGLLDGKYELVRAVAEGGLGQVFEARHVVIGHRVAVKMIRRALSRDPEMSARFLLEARAAGAIEHPGCIKVVDRRSRPTAGPTS